MAHKELKYDVEARSALEAGVTQGFSDLNVTGPIRWQPSSVVRAFSFLKENTRAVPKVTMPAPNCVHYYMGGTQRLDPAPFRREVTVGHLLADKGVPRYLGIDFSPARIRQARAVAPGYRFEVADVFETQFSRQISLTTHRLAVHSEERGRAALQREITQLLSDQTDIDAEMYLLLDEHGRKLAGNLDVFAALDLVRDPPQPLRVNVRRDGTPVDGFVAVRKLDDGSVLAVGTLSTICLLPEPPATLRRWRM